MQIDAATLVAQMAAQLAQVSVWLDLAEAHAAAKKFDPATLLGARLAPDQFPLGRQIGAACDTAKLVVPRLTGKTAPAHADDETTFAQCRARVADVVAFIGAVEPADYGCAAEAKITFGWMPGKYLTAVDYLVRFALPNLNFHLAHAYAILRHNGVAVGKADFLGAVPFRDV